MVLYEPFPMLRTFKPRLTRPHDFSVFWDWTLEELERRPAETERTPEGTAAAGRPALERLAWTSLDGARIHGYLLSWPDETPRPLVVHGHGYGSDCGVMRDWADAGLHVLGLDLRGCGRSAAAVTNRSSWGYVLTGRWSPEASVLRGAICDYVRALEVGRALLGPRVLRTVCHGVSFSGGLALMAEALYGGSDLLVVQTPTFGWSEGRHFLVKSGSGMEINRYLEARPEEAEDLMTVFRYFDTVNFADRVACPTLVGLGLRDDVVPAGTVYAIANRLEAPHEIVELPVSHSKDPQEALWERFVARWMDLALRGIPGDFGTTRVSRITDG